MKSKRITIRDKKVKIIRMFVNTMKKSLAEMEQDIKTYEGDKMLSEAMQDAHFEKLRCDSGNLNEVLEDNRMALSIFFETIELDRQMEKSIEDARGGREGPYVVDSIADNECVYCDMDPPQPCQIPLDKRPIECPFKKS